MDFLYFALWTVKIGQRSSTFRMATTHNGTKQKKKMMMMEKKKQQKQNQSTND